MGFFLFGVFVLASNVCWLALKVPVQQSTWNMDPAQKWNMEHAQESCSDRPSWSLTELLTQPEQLKSCC